MNSDKKTSALIVYFVISILAILYLLLLTDTNDSSFFIGWIVAVMCLILLKKQTSFDLKITDILVVGYLLFMVFSSSTGINSTASMEALVSTFLGSGIYLIVRVYFRFLSVRLNRLKNKLLANYLRNRGNDLATVRNSAFCVAILSNNSFICKYNIFFRKYELSVAIL